MIRVLFGVGGNIAVSVGPQGALIVDDQFPELMPKIKAAIEQLPKSSYVASFIKLPRGLEVLQHPDITIENHRCERKVTAIWRSSRPHVPLIGLVA